MTTRQQPGDDAEPRDLVDLLTDAGPRPEVPVADLEAIKAASRQEWRQRYGKAATPKVRSIDAPRISQTNPVWGSRSFRRLVAAAILLPALILGWWWWSSNRPVTGEVVLASGAVEDAGGHPLTVGEALRAGTVVRSGEDGLLALRFGEGRSLRLDARSEVKLVSRWEIALEAGAVYIESPPGRETGARRGVVVVTALGTFEEIGTQFEVRVLPDRDSGEKSVRLRVREGVVKVQPGLPQAGGAPRTVKPGQELRLQADGLVERRTVALHGRQWAWAAAAAPPFPFAQAPLETFLEWFARETGLQPDFLAESALLTTTVSGDFSGLTVEGTLEAALLSSGLRYRIEGERVVIEERSELPAHPQGKEESGP